MMQSSEPLQMPVPVLVPLLAPAPAQLPEAGSLAQPPSEADIKNNLQKYSPFYRQAMHFDKAEVKTLFYVAHGNFSSEKAVEKLQAFRLFKDKKIVFVEFQRSEDRLRDPPAGVFPAVYDNGHSSDTMEVLRAVAVAVAGQVNGNPSAHQHGPGDHFTVKVKMPVSPDSPVIPVSPDSPVIPVSPVSPDSLDSYKLEELIIYGDGKCGIVASIVALREICKDYNAPIEGPPIFQFGGISTVESDSNDTYDKLLHKENKKEVDHYKGLGLQYGDEKLHYHVAKDLALVKNSSCFSGLKDSLRTRVSALLDNTKDTHLLTPKEVHEIISTNAAHLGNVANISPQHIHEIPSEETLSREGAVAVIPPSVSRGEKKEGIELRKDAKHEFRIIVLNIVHEWIDEQSKKHDHGNFSKMDNSDFLESLINEKLGDVYAQKIKVELGGEITFKSLLAIDEVGAGVGDENLKKERETFYSAQCSFSAGGQGEAGVIDNPNSKVWERITDVIYKYNAHAYQTSNDDFKTSFTSALEASMQIDGLNYTEKQFLGSTLTLFGERNRSDSSMLLPTPAPYQLDLPGHTQAAHAHANAGHSPLKMEIESDFSPGHVQPAPGNAKAGHYHSRMEVTSHSPSSTGQSTPVEPGTDQILGPLQRDPCAQPLFPGHLFYPAQSAGGAHARLGHAPAQPVAHAKAGHAPARLGHAPAQPVATTELGGSSEELLGVIIPNTDPPQPGPTSNPPKAKPDQDLDKFKELIEAVLGVIGNLGDVIKTKYEEARKNLLEKVKELEKSIEQPQEKKPVDQGSEANETPASELLKPVFTVLRSCLGDRDNIR